MRKKVIYGITAVTVLMMAAILGMAQIQNVFNPNSNENVAIEDVSMDRLKVWMQDPSFSKWTNMNALDEYLQNKGTSVEELKREGSEFTRDQLRELTGERGVVREYTAYKRDKEAISDVDCDLDDKSLEFELENVGKNNWFLTQQPLTLKDGKIGEKKKLSEAHSQATKVRLYVNQHFVNNNMPSYQNGERLFFQEGRTFAHACQAGFLRPGQSVDCDLEPIEVKQGQFWHNSYRFATPDFRETGTFECD